MLETGADWKPVRKSTAVDRAVHYGPGGNDRREKDYGKDTQHLLKLRPSHYK